MKKRIITVIAAALAVLTFTAVSNAAAPTESAGVLVKTDDGYLITGTLRDADGKVVGTVHGTLIEQTTGFNSCPFESFTYYECVFNPSLATCNLLGGELTFNFQGKTYDAIVLDHFSHRVTSALCLDTDNPSTYELSLFGWSTSHVPPGLFPDIFGVGGTVQQMTPTLFKWSGGWSCDCLSPPT